MRPHAVRFRVRVLSLVLATTVGLAITAVTGTAAHAAVSDVVLGAAKPFAVLAGTTVTNTGPSVISGDLGVSPGSAVTGFPPGLVNNGAIHAADTTASGAQTDLTTAYNVAAGETPATSVGTDLGGQTLVAGIYNDVPAGTLGLTGTVTLDAQGDPNAVWVFQAASTLITAPNSTVALINGADACHVFWQVGSSATLDTNTTFVGTILALSSISALTGTTVNGRLLARNGAVTLDTNVVTRPDCPVVPPVTSTVTTTATTTTTVTPPTVTTTVTPPTVTSTTTAVPPTVTTTSTPPTETSTVTATTTQPVVTETRLTTVTTTIAPPTVTVTVTATPSTRRSPSNPSAPPLSDSIITSSSSTSPTSTSPATSTTSSAEILTLTSTTTVGAGIDTDTGTTPTLPNTGPENVNTLAMAGLLAILMGSVLLFLGRRSSGYQLGRHDPRSL